MKKFILPALLLAGLSMNAQTTIYTGNGSLTSNRTVSLGTYSLGFDKLVPSGVTYGSTDLRVQASTILSAGALINATSGTRSLHFMELTPGGSYAETAPTTWFSIISRNNYARLRHVAVQGAGSSFTLFDKTQTEVFKVEESGGVSSLYMPMANSRIGIGTTSFTDGADTYMLAVNGNVRAKRVKVYTTWADYVFEDGYKLPTLDEVEKHIKEKGHLQDIPSAKDVEANGIELGEMNKLLLQKVEELTLYMIEQKKENEKQAQHIQKLEEQVKGLTEKK